METVIGEGVTGDAAANNQFTRLQQLTTMTLTLPLLTLMWNTVL